MDNQTYISLYFIGLLWILSSFYVIKWHIKRGDVSFGVVFISFLLGPILAIFVRNNETEEKNIREHIERDRENELERWYETNDLINQVRRPNAPTWTNTTWRGMTIPPPPPISQTKKENKIKDFKFLRDK